MSKSGDIPSLDGLRAIAVGLVFLSHLDPRIGQLVPGGLGVTVFFVLSGFLITTLLRVEQVQYGSVSFHNFYLRRALRLFPPLYLVTAIAALAVAMGWVQGSNSFSGLFSVLFYWANYYVVIHHFDGLPLGLGIVWSLAIEEHFYFLWPVLFALLNHWRCRQQTWAWVIALLCVIPLLLRVGLATLGHASDAYIEYATETRFDGLMWGCLLAMIKNPWLDEPMPARPVAEFLLLLAALLLLAFSLVYRDSLFRATFRYSLQAIALMPIFWLAVARSQQLWFRPLNWKTLRYIGQISYGIYLSHHLIILGLAYQQPDWSLPLRSVVAVALVGIFCVLLRHLLENPLGRWRKRLHRHSG